MDTMQAFMTVAKAFRSQRQAIAALQAEVETLRADAGNMPEGEMVDLISSVIQRWIDRGDLTGDINTQDLANEVADKLDMYDIARLVEGELDNSRMAESIVEHIQLKVV